MEHKEDYKTQLDTLLIAAINKFKSSALLPGAPAQDNTTSHSHSRFGPPTSEEEKGLTTEAGIPQEKKAGHKLLCKRV